MIQTNVAMSEDILNNIIIPRAPVENEMIDGYIHLISNKRQWNNCLIKNNQVKLVGLVDFIFKINQKTIYGRYFSGMV